MRPAMISAHGSLRRKIDKTEGQSSSARQSVCVISWKEILSASLLEFIWKNSLAGVSALPTAACPVSPPLQFSPSSGLFVVLALRSDPFRGFRGGSIIKGVLACPGTARGEVQ